MTSTSCRPRDVKEVVDLCYQCKLCFNHCPYTPPHRWEVDFPRLMLRARAAQARQSGVSLQDRMLGNADLVGKLGSLDAPLSNWMNEFGVHRAFMQAVVGIHKERNLPSSRADLLVLVQRRSRASADAPRRSAPRRLAPRRRPARSRCSRRAASSTTSRRPAGPR